MTLTKFLFLDATLILLGIPFFLLLLKWSKTKDFLLGQFKETGYSSQISKSLPNYENLIELENLARKDGSGITSDSLVAIWRFFSVWKQGTDREDLISSSLLRSFLASLEIKRDISNHFSIVNSITFGFLSIRFLGTGTLKGNQPLLPFFFNSIEFSIGKRVLFSRKLEQPEEKDMPFFALISIDKHGKWLSARGRGGGLALWIKD